MNVRTFRVGTLMALALMVAALAMIAASPPLLADGHVEPVFDYDPPFFPEGIAIDKRGNIFVSIAIQSELRKITPDGTETTLATLPTGGFGLLGLAVDAPGNVYAALATVDLSTSGVYRIDKTGASVRLAGTEAIIVPNGLAFDKRGNLYVTDTIGGAVYVVPPGGSAELWVQSPLLEGTGVAGLGVPVGANGITYRHGVVHVANTEQGTLVRIPVEKGGSAGVPTVFVDDVFGADGLALDVKGNIYIASVLEDKLIRVNLRSGERSVLAEGDDGLDGPASLAFGTGQGNRKYLYITNFVLLSDPNPGIVRVDVGVPGVPLP